MRNQELEAAQAYHEASKLSYINLSNKPSLYKSYTGAPVISLPTDFPMPEAPTLSAVATVNQEGEYILDLTALAQLLYFSAGLIKKGVFPTAGEVHFRAAASAGALYPVEVYLVCKDIPGLEAGIYHFSPSDFILHQLRKSDYRGDLSEATGHVQAVSSSPVIFIFTAIFWRSAWKYRTRSYRYCFWDNGTMVANLLATASAASLPAQVLTSFADDQVNDLLGIQMEQEASLCLIPIGKGGGPQPIANSPDLPPMSAKAVEPSSEQRASPEIHQIHAASSLTIEEVSAWRGILTSQSPQVQGPFYPLQTPEESALASSKLGETILRRSSTRRFAREPISYAQFNAILNHSTRGVPTDFLGPGGASLLHIYTIVNAVEGLTSGCYFFSPQRQGLELLREGAFREEAGHLCFEQALGADASAVVFFLADLETVLQRYGNRSYRAAQLEAGILGGKLYLCAHSLGLGASGLTFYDDDVTDFFLPHSSGKSPMFVVALGKPSPRNRVRPFRSRVAVSLDALARGAAKRET